MFFRTPKNARMWICSKHIHFKGITAYDSQKIQISHLYKPNIC